MQTVVIRSWSELQDQLFGDMWNRDLRRFRSPFLFRGVGQADFDLIPSLKRLGGSYWDLERHVLRNFRKYAHRSTVPHDDDWNWLALGQHHGLPTRLLDWTYSPYVALHFATAEISSYDRDGAIIMANYRQMAQSLPEGLQNPLTRNGSHVLTAELLREYAGSLEELDEKSAAHGEEWVCFFEPPSLDDRITNQFAVFSMTSHARLDLSRWFAERPDFARKLVIDHALKWEIRDKLDQANVTERVLFPGLDGLSRWLARHYMSPEGAHLRAKDSGWSAQQEIPPVQE
ncbi:FRG domain-containing protein [Jiella mangrovi]|uniref:FRG domain-containing protein n=1 Tax=Jiella mangrovi TaxID=2821407 RepID=A0ABS4BGB0_9HYPH|nr:FRG domain-containing protein [Jiella mangrovi]MBP0615793.1 FRG domain-containing protein [Jiella mangrovi]